MKKRPWIWEQRKIYGMFRENKGGNEIIIISKTKEIINISFSKKNSHFFPFRDRFFLCSPGWAETPNFSPLVSWMQRLVLSVIYNSERGHRNWLVLWKMLKEIQAVGKWYQMEIWLSARERRTYIMYNSTYRKF